MSVSVTPGEHVGTWNVFTWGDEPVTSTLGVPWDELPERAREQIRSHG